MAKFNELYQGSMVAVGKKDSIYFFKRGDEWIETKHGLSIIEADRKNGRKVLAKKHELSYNF